MMKTILLIILSIPVFYILCRIFWKAGIDQIDQTLNDKLEKYTTKIKKDGNETQE